MRAYAARSGAWACPARQRWGSPTYCCPWLSLGGAPLLAPQTRRAGGGSGGQVAKDALGNDVKTNSWLATHAKGDHSLVQGLKVRPGALIGARDGPDSGNVLSRCVEQLGMAVGGRCGLRGPADMSISPLTGPPHAPTTGRPHLPGGDPGGHHRELRHQRRVHPPGLRRAVGCGEWQRLDTRGARQACPRDMWLARASPAAARRRRARHGCVHQPRGQLYTYTGIVAGMRATQPYDRAAGSRGGGAVGGSCRRPADWPQHLPQSGAMLGSGSWHGKVQMPRSWHGRAAAFAGGGSRSVADGNPPACAPTYADADPSESCLSPANPLGREQVQVPVPRQPVRLDRQEDPRPRSPGEQRRLQQQAQQPHQQQEQQQRRQRW